MDKCKCGTPLKNRKDKKGKFCPLCIQKEFRCMGGGKKIKRA